jgi:Uri superfamily endonuclease
MERRLLSLLTQRASAVHRLPASRRGCYSLIISLTQRKIVRVGKLGVALFPEGTYVYTGSAMGGLAARLKRHLTRKKQVRWHIDYLLILPQAQVHGMILYPPARNQECRQNQKIAALPGAAVTLKGFGASDCKSGCASHLYFFAKGRPSQLAAGLSLMPAVPATRRGQI